MQRGVIIFTKEESLELNQLTQANEAAPALLQQKFANETQDAANYELSVEEVNWLLDQLPTPQNSTEIQNNIRTKLYAFLA
ncbi:MAG: hypothetical protein GW947_01635 [Candidatus Pacebacteria bacterium]|nr:hypothetical protein [Candidatus Paceibacterota bacterium]PIR59995.1 MAG: hypothetical protein COU68_03190 [Candidatus Pacebacteria bacterium CG10_big_fil_rev_8_21_14_0_10_45_6]